MEEIEVKFLNVDQEAIEKKLLEIGAKKVGDYFYKRRIFDYPDLRLDSAGAWIRLRDEGDKITLGFKQRLGITSSDGSTSDAGMEEFEVVVSDFEQTTKIFLHAGFIEKFYQENKRTRWEKDGVEFDIDTWPMLPPYLEIEAESYEKIDAASDWLGLDPNEKKIYSNFQMYLQKGIDLRAYQHIGFDTIIKKQQQ